MVQRMVERNVSLVVGLLLGALAVGVWMTAHPIPCALSGHGF